MSELIGGVLLAAVNVFVQMAPYLTLGFFLAGWLYVLIPREVVAEKLGRHRRMGPVWAALVGVPLPLCSCGVLPFARLLKDRGASPGSIVSFLLTTPQTGVDSILVSASILGWPLTFWKVGTAFVSGVLGGFAANAVGSGGGTASAAAVGGEDACCASHHHGSASTQRHGDGTESAESAEKADSCCCGEVAKPQAPVSCCSEKEPVPVAKEPCCEGEDSCCCGEVVKPQAPVSCCSAKNTAPAPVAACCCEKESAPIAKASCCDEKASPVSEPCCCEEEHEHKQESSCGKPGKIRSALYYGFFQNLGDVAGWLILGLLAAGAISYAVPEGFFSKTLGGGWTEMLAVLVISMLLYVCATGSVPIGAALAAKGLSAGAVMVFLIAGPAVSAVSIAVLGKTLGRRLLFVYLATIVAISVISGLAFNAFFPDFGKTILQAEHCEHLSWWQWVCAGVLGCVLLFHFTQRIVRKLGKAWLRICPECLSFCLKGCDCCGCVH